MKTRRGTPEHSAKMRAKAKAYWTPERRAKARLRAQVAYHDRRIARGE